MTKSAVRLAREALAVGERALPRDSARTSRHAYTQTQLFALLVLKQFLRVDYRGLVTFVAEWAELRRALRLKRVPHHATVLRRAPAAGRRRKRGAFLAAFGVR